MRFKPSKEIIITAIVVISSIAVAFWFLNTPYFNVVFEWSQKNFYLFLFVLFLLKVISIVYPPITGGIFTLAAIPIIGWEWAFFVDFLGSNVGGAANYYVAKKYGHKIVQKLLGREAVEKIDSIKIKKGKEIESIIVTRIFIGNVVLELIHYAAGILRVPFKKYLLGIVISHIIVGIPTFFLVANIFELNNIFYSAILVVIAIPILYFLKDRYLE